MKLIRFRTWRPRASRLLSVWGLLAAFLLTGTATLRAQDPLQGLWQGYDAEWQHTSAQLIALAEATPADKFAWRPAPGVRSTSEVYMHIVDANFYLLSITGPKMPDDLKENMDKTVTSKEDEIATKLPPWLSTNQPRFPEGAKGAAAAILQNLRSVETCVVFSRGVQSEC
jgi:hypothetical protein